MASRLLRLLAAVGIVMLITMPLVALRAGSSGFEVALVPSLKVGAGVLVAGLAGLYVQWALVTKHPSIPLTSAAAAIAGGIWACHPPALLEIWYASAAVGAIAGGFAGALAAFAYVEISRRWPLASRVTLCVAAGALLVSLPFVATGKWIGLVLETLVYVTIAMGLNIALGMTGLLVLGHAAFWAVGAYTFSMLSVHFQTNFWIAFPAAGAAAALVGLILGLPALRLRGDYLAIVTLAFGESIRWIIKNTGSVTGGDAGIPGSELPDASLRVANGFLGRYLWQPTDRTGCYYFALVLAAVCVAAVSLLRNSRNGRAMLALREDETAARCMGINTVWVKLIAFTSAAMWAGLAGVIHPIYRGQVTPELFNFDASVTFVAMVVLGGLGSVAGSVIGAAVLWILPALLRDWVPEVQDYRMLVFGAVLAAMMVVRPQGIAGGAAKAARA